MAFCSITLTRPSTVASLPTSATRSLTKVALIDSGIGGLTIASEIRKKLPSLVLHYTADLAAFPYGELNAERIYQRLAHITRVIQETHHPDIVIIACNTASTQVLDRLRSEFSVPFVGVVPAIKPAASQTQSNHMLVLSTPGTAQSGYLQALIKRFAASHIVKIHGSSALVKLAERELVLGHPPTQEELESVLPLTLPSTIDTGVLACTHFPILQPGLKKIFPHIKHWVDSGEAIARRVEQLLIERNALTTPLEKPLNVFCCTRKEEAPYLTTEIERRLGSFEWDDLAI